MIRIRLEYNSEIFTQIANDIETFEVLTKALFKQSVNKVKPDALRELRLTPARRQWKKEDFANDKSRKAFFASTKGKPYERTGKYAAGWQIEIKDTDTGGQMVISNNASSMNNGKRVFYGKFVGGSFARSGRDFQQKGHVRTGWPKSQNTADKWLLVAQDDFEQRVTKYIGDKWGKVSTGTKNQ